jgi:hypothetical protein
MREEAKMGDNMKMKKYKLLDGDMRVVIMKGANQAEAAQALRQAAEDVEKTSAATWEQWDKTAE